jgi:hypothetical protein
MRLTSALIASCLPLILLWVPAGYSSPSERFGQLLESIQAQRTGSGNQSVQPSHEEDRIGAEILEIQSPNSIRAWISPEISRDEFAALEVDEGWRKNQPRESVECGPDDGRFIKSPDAADDDILIQEFYGYSWFHSATVFETNLLIDDEGFFTGFRVKKYHEITYNQGSCMVLLTSPEGEVFFRVGRDADRPTDTFSVPEGWRVESYTTPETLIIELFDETLVIRTDNQDSFQGPVPGLANK